MILEQKYFKNPEAYCKGLELLKKDKKMQKEHPNFMEYEDAFLSDLSEADVTNLQNAIDLSEEKLNVKEDHQRLQFESEKHTKQDIELQKAIETWVTEKARRTKESSIIEYKSSVALFHRVVSELTDSKPVMLTDITTKLINEYCSIIYKLPSNISKNKVTQSKTIKEILELNLKPRSETTTVKNFKHVADLINWLTVKQYAVIDGVLNILRSHKKPLKKHTKIRKPFDSEDLKSIFNDLQYNPKYPALYWCPLLALFTGCRSGELVQLYKGDVKLIDGIWVLDINEQDNKELKNESSKRIIPLHPQLKKIGFLEYVQSCKGDKLFNETRDKKNQFSSFSKRFLRYRDKVGASPRNDMELRDFHSFRHVVRTELQLKNVDEIIIDQLLGHSSSNHSVGASTYSHNQLIDRKFRAIKTLNYDFLNFDCLKK